ncbi:MAG: DUF4190 domain-containing protein, partial [Bifidobacteriaceae bacterium]|nr:DUF4190 domain-containing protein [Bifidobacteriaceae bacterium]
MTEQPMLPPGANSPYGPSSPGYGPPPPNYGPPPPGYYYPPPFYEDPQAKSKNGWGVASLVCSIGGIVVLFGLFVGSILGVIFGHIALNAVRSGLADNRGVALWGTILGYIGIVLSALLWLVLVL